MECWREESEGCGVCEESKGCGMLEERKGAGEADTM